MKITVKLFATFRIGRDKIQIMDLQEGTTPESIVDELGIDVKDIAILLINGRDGEINSTLIDGDVLAIFPPVGGG
jgi:molybdopterin synthase sulfur carrier subunit